MARIGSKAARRSELDLARRSLADRRLGADQVARIKDPTRVRYQRSHGTRALFTASFTSNPLVDDLVDKWAHRWNVSRSNVIRQAILRANALWEREEARSGS